MKLRFRVTGFMVTDTTTVYLDLVHFDGDTVGLQQAIDDGTVFELVPAEDLVDRG